MQDWCALYRSSPKHSTAEGYRGSVPCEQFHIGVVSLRHKEELRVGSTLNSDCHLPKEHHPSCIRRVAVRSRQKCFCESFWRQTEEPDSESHIDYPHQLNRVNTNLIPRCSKCSLKLLRFPCSEGDVASPLVRWAEIRWPLTARLMKLFYSLMCTFIFWYLHISIT